MMKMFKRPICNSQFKENIHPWTEMSVWVTKHVPLYCVHLLFCISISFHLPCLLLLHSWLATLPRQSFNSLDRLNLLHCTLHWNSKACVACIVWIFLHLRYSYTGFSAVVFFLCNLYFKWYTSDLNLNIWLKVKRQILTEYLISE